MHHDAVPDSSLAEEETRTYRVSFHLHAHRHHDPADDLGRARGRVVRDLLIMARLGVNRAS